MPLIHPAWLQITIKALHTIPKQPHHELLLWIETTWNLFLKLPYWHYPLWLLLHQCFPIQRCDDYEIRSITVERLLFVWKNKFQALTLWFCFAITLEWFIRFSMKLWEKFQHILTRWYLFRKRFWKYVSSYP